MESNNSFQNGQESKENYDIDDSPMANSTGREQANYANTSKEFQEHYKLSANSHKLQCYTEHQEDNSIRIELAKTMQKYSKELSPNMNINKNHATQILYVRNSEPSLSENSVRNENRNDTRRLSSIQIEVSAEDDKFSNLPQNPSSKLSDSHHIKNSSLKDVGSNQPGGRISFNTPQRTTQKLVDGNLEGDFSTQVFDALQAKDRSMPKCQNAMYSNHNNNKYLDND